MNTEALPFTSRKSILDHLVRGHGWDGKASDHFQDFLPGLTELEIRLSDGRWMFDTSELMKVHRELHRLAEAAWKP